MAEHPSLTNFPLEIIQKIASLCPAHSVLDLSQTCRYLRSACHDTTVMQASFITHADHPSANALPGKESIRKLIAAAISSKDILQVKATWAHLAFAAYSFPKPLLDDLEKLVFTFESVPWDNSSPPAEPLSRGLTNLIGALSTFTVLGFSVLSDPIAKDFNAAAALSGVAVRLCDNAFWQAQDSGTRLTLASQVALCLATGSLESPCLNNMPLLIHRISTAFGFDHFNSDHESAILAEWYATLEGGQVIGLLTAACLTRLLRSDTRVRLRNDLPYPPALPFLNVVGRGGSLPLLDENIGIGALRASGPGAAMRAFGTAPSWSRWVRNNIDVIIEDLAKGEWVGYYTHGAESENEVDEPLRNIHFSMQPDPHDRAMVLLRAEGCVDSIGEFRLEGQLSRTAGWVSLEKQYAAGQMWYNAGWLTPLGIAGYWGDQPGRGMGFVWMFKKEWAREKAWKDVARVDSHGSQDDFTVG